MEAKTAQSDAAESAEEADELGNTQEEVCEVGGV